MSFEGFPGSEIRSKLDHPVIDADAHVVECDFAHLDFVRQIADESVAKRVTAERANHGPTVRGFWWGLPSGAHTADRATAQLPHPAFSACVLSARRGARAAGRSTCCTPRCSPRSATGCGRWR